MRKDEPLKYASGLTIRMFRPAVLYFVVVLMLSPLVSTSEAGLFEKIRANHQARMEARKKKAAKPRPRPVYRSNYRDAHGDAYINHTLLEIEKESERKVIVALL